MATPREALKPGARSRLYLVTLATCLAALLPAPLNAIGAEEPAPARIVSLAPSITETLVRLGVTGRLVGVSRFCEVPARPDLPRLGGYLDPDLESIVALAPDLVLAMPQPSLEQGLRRFDIPIRTTQPQWSSVATILASIHAIGEYVGHPEEAEHLAGEIRARLDGIAQRAADLPAPDVLLVIERQPGNVVAAGPKSHLHELLRIAGARNALTEGGAYPSLGVENIADAAPDAIIDLSTPADALTDAIRKQVRDDWGAYPFLPAVRNGRIYPEPPGRIVQPGPGMAEAAERLFRLIHGAAP